MKGIILVGGSGTMEAYNQNDMHEAGLDMVFVQDSQSMSTKGVLRGLHFQEEYP